MLCPACAFANAPDATRCQACGVALGGTAAHVQALAAGAALRGGAYVIGRVLGQGGFGITYQGREPHLGRTVAIKEFFPAVCARQGRSVLASAPLTVADFEAARARFLDEARILARFDHPGIVRVLTVFEENGTAYMAMEYLEGHTLAARLRDAGRLPEAEVLALAEQIGAALEAVHAAGLLHRDIKPDNVIVKPSGRAVLIDFGTAKEFALGQTQRHTVVVTPGYAPLEQYAGRARRGPFSDVYALAATLYHLLAGEAPPAATDRAAGVELEDVRAFNPAVSEAVARALHAGLETEAARRPQTPRALLQLMQAQAAAPIPHSPLPTPHSSFPIPQSAAPLRACDGPITSLAFAPDGVTLAVGGLHDTVRLWDVRTGEQSGTLWVGDMVGAVAFAPGRDLLACGKWEEVTLWDARSGEMVGKLRGHTLWVNALAFSPAGSLLASASKDGAVRLWDVHSGNLLGTATHPQEVHAVAFAPRAQFWPEITGDGTVSALTLATVADDGRVRLWHVASGTQVQDPLAALWAGRHESRALGVAFAPDGRTVASGSADTLIKLWDARTGTLLCTLMEHTGGVCALAFAPGQHAAPPAAPPSGPLLASASFDATVRLWDAAAGASLHVLRGHTDRVTALAFSPDGTLLATGGLDKTVRLWRV